MLWKEGVVVLFRTMKFRCFLFIECFLICCRVSFNYTIFYHTISYLFVVPCVCCVCGLKHLSYCHKIRWNINHLVLFLKAIVFPPVWESITRPTAYETNRLSVRLSSSSPVGALITVLIRNHSKDSSFHGDSMSLEAAIIRHSHELK